MMLFLFSEEKCFACTLSLFFLLVFFSTACLSCFSTLPPKQVWKAI